MKKWLTLLLVLSLCLFTASAVAEGAKTVTVNGSATVTLIPDSASFTVGVTTQDEQVSAAQAVNADAMQNVLDALRALGVEDNDLQTDSYTVNPLYDYQSGTDMLTGYAVSNTVQVTVRSIDLLPTLLDAAIAAGANETYAVSFTSSQYAAAYDQALQAAVQDALRKADLLAQALGLEAGDVLSLAENDANTYVYSLNSRAFSYDSAIATPVSTGTLSVAADVTAVLELE